jgi:chromosome segregation protein
LHLSKLKIFGFKSFAKKVEVHFPGNGLTSVVGPNGCGKSNIVDAIRWVMGEQRAKQLRSTKMEDVIFSGCDGHPALNMAEVSLIINNDQGLLPSEYSEIQITRRAFRDGSSEYLINNQECRLKDIQNLFFDTGMGASSYSLMEQRMIDAILQRPEDRRLVLEEAAGISRYKQQRKEAIRQLERTNVDLERVEENLRATRRTLRMYEKQVEKARAFQKLQQRLKQVDVSLSYDKYADFRDNFFALEKQWKQVSEDQSALQVRLAEVQTLLEERKLDMTDEENTYRELERQVIDKSMELKDLNNQVARHGDHVQHIDEQVQNWQEEMADARNQVSRLMEQQSELQQELAPLDAELSQAESQLQLAMEQRNVHKANYEELRSTTSQLDSTRQQALQAYLSLRDELSSGNQRMMVLEERRSSLQQQIEQFEQEIEQLAGAVSELDEGLEHTLATQKEQWVVLTSQRDELRDDYSKKDAQERELEREKAVLQSRHEMLERMIATGEGAGAGTKKLLENKHNQINGMLADHIKVKKHQAELETAMGASMQALLLTPEADVFDLLAFADEQKQGSVLLGMPDFPQTSTTVPEITEDSFLGWANDFVESNKQYIGLASAMLGRYGIVANFETALQLAKRFAGQGLHFVAGRRIVSTTGLIRGGAGLSKGNEGGSGLLNRTQELENIQTILQRMQAELEECALQKEQLQEQILQVSSQRETLQEELQELTARLQQQESAQKVQQSNLQDRQNRLHTANSNLQKVQQELQVLRSQMGADEEDRLLQAEQVRNDKEQEYQAKAALLTELQSVLEQVNEECLSAERALAAKKQRKVQIVQMLESTADAIEAQQNIQETRMQQIEKVQYEKENAGDVLGEMKEQIQVQFEVLEALEERRDEAKLIYDEKLRALDAYRDEISAINRKLHEWQQNSHDYEMKMQVQQSNARNIKERMFEQYELNLDDQDSLPLIEYDKSSAEAEVRELRKQIKALGSVNMDAFDNFEDEKKQMDEVQVQYDDLDRARVSLERTIRRLDKIARERFLETFEKIKENFREVFAGITNGGEARLHLEGDDPLEAKIQVNAAQPGRTLKGIDLLSGGEKAMTAVALLFSLYMVKPSPYSILDEVDAPLDDANVQRFVKLLRRFSRNTQFIIVTHNKHTMAASDRLYGVTQEVKGISNISAVQLDEAAEFAA